MSEIDKLTLIVVIFGVINIVSTAAYSAAVVSEIKKALGKHDE